MHWLNVKTVTVILLTALLLGKGKILLYYAEENIEAAWQVESHLNRYMWLNKPTKVLSPEYLWQDFKSREPKIHIITQQNYAEIRPNV